MSETYRATNVHQVVDAGTTTKELASGHGVDLATSIGLLDAGHAPVVFRTTDHGRIHARRRDGRVVHAVLTGLQHTNSDVGIFCQPCGNAQPCSTSANDDEIILLRDKLINAAECIASTGAVHPVRTVSSHGERFRQGSCNSYKATSRLVEDSTLQRTADDG